MNIKFYGGEIKKEFLQDFPSYYPELEDSVELFGGYENKKQQHGRYPTHEDMVSDEFKQEYEEAKKLFPTPVAPFEKLLQIKQEIPYKSARLNYFQNAMKKTCHNGQRKLFLCELQHLVHCLDSTSEEALVIYAGAAPSNHSPMLGSMFPNCKFIFVDPNEFNMYFGKFHNSHYTRAGVETIYMEVSVSNKHMYSLDEGKKMVAHYTAPDKPFDVMEYVKTHDTNLGYDRDEFIKFVLDTNYQYYLIENYFTDDIAEMLGELISKLSCKIIFWSDIRTAMITEGDPLDEDIIINTAWMTSWLKRMTKNLDNKRHFQAMLKFRPPFGNQKTFNKELVEELTSGARELGYEYGEVPIKFFKGEVYMQCWHPLDSAETRLWCDLKDIKDTLIEYPLKPHEERCFAYNMVYRYGLSYESPYNTIEGVDHCGDCSLEGLIWKRYSEKYYSKLPEKMITQKIKSLILGLGQITGRPLNRFPHGKFE